MRRMGYKGRNYTVGAASGETSVKAIKELERDDLGDELRRDLLNLASDIIWNVENGIHMHMPTHLFNSVLTRDDITVSDMEELLSDMSDELKAIKIGCHTDNYRLIFGLGEFTCITPSSRTPNSQLSSAILRMDKLAIIADHIGWPFFGSPIVLDIGCAVGQRTMHQLAELFIHNFKMLSKRTQDRLVLVNNASPKGMSVTQLYSRIYADTGIPIMADVYHHQFNAGECIEEQAVIELAMSTWPQGINPIISVSSSKKRDEAQPLLPLATHADFIHRDIPEVTTDVLIDAGLHEVAVLDVILKEG